MKLRSIKDAPVHKGTRVILRADFDVITVKVKDNFKVQECLSTIRFLLKKGARVRIISHLGRPHGAAQKKLSLKHVAKYLGELLGRRIVFITDPLQRKVFQKYNSLSDALFFENIRFWPEEERNDSTFASYLARWGDLYVNEAFADSHRMHASVVALSKQLPSFAGLHLEKEIVILSRLLKKPRQPFLAVIGGIKLETKLPLVKRFLKEADRVFIGGGVANSIFRAKGFETGKSTVDTLRDKGILGNKKLYLPPDVVVTKGVPSRYFRIVRPQGVQKNEYIVDVGPKSVELFDLLLKGIKTVVWNGPLGFTPYFSKGTKEFARKLAKTGAFRVVGGGDTIAALREFGISQKSFTHVSTGGGAMLEFLAGKKLPGLEVLKKR